MVLKGKRGMKGKGGEGTQGGDKGSCARKKWDMMYAV